MFFLYHLYVQIIYQSFKKKNGEFTNAELRAEATVGISAQRQGFSAIPALRQIYLSTKIKNQLVIEPLKLPWPADKRMGAPC